MLFKDSNVEYVLSYKLSQDHVEMFFALIRSKNGFCHNPTTVQFQSAFKKLLINNLNISVSASANCTPQDSTVLIGNETLTPSRVNIKQKPKKKRIRPLVPFKKPPVRVVDYLAKNRYMLKNGFKDGWLPSQYSVDAIKHVAGYVVRTVKTKFRKRCPACIRILENGRLATKSKLSLIKNRGGLIFVSEDINLICQSTENIIRGFKDSFLIKNIHNKIVIETLKILPDNIFNDEHFISCQDHRDFLIYTIINNYICTRLVHESNKIKDQMMRTRNYQNKQCDFKGQ